MNPCRQVFQTIAVALALYFMGVFSAVVEAAPIVTCKNNPWETFPDQKANAPYRPLLSFQRKERIGKTGPFPGHPLTIDMKMGISSSDGTGNDLVKIGSFLVSNVPVTEFLPAGDTVAYYFEPNGSQCILTRAQMEEKTYRDNYRRQFGYTGVRLELEQNDTIVANVSSALRYSEPSIKPDAAPFGGAPCQTTNMHTHGLLVSPYTTGKLRGDYVLGLSAQSPPAPGQVLADACADAKTATESHGAHGDIVETLHHRIKIPARPTKLGQADALDSGKHPSGLFWFHPHLHGYSASQLTGGNSGLITVGRLSEYTQKEGDNNATPKGASNDQAPGKNMRFLMIKDAQIDQAADPNKFVFRPSIKTDLCAQGPGPDSSGFWLEGFCKNSDNSSNWVFTVNGVQNPRIEDIRAGESEIWRIANASPTVSYWLSIVTKEEAENPPLNPDRSLNLHPKNFKVLARDGAALPPAPNSDSEEKEILLMPGARIEILIENLGNQEWKLVTRGLQTGGDGWPRVVLATLKSKGAAPPAVALENTNYSLKTNGPSVNSDFEKSRVPLKGAASAIKPPPSLAELKPCVNLANGRERVVLFVKNNKFGSDKDNWEGKDNFGLIAGVRDAGVTDLSKAAYFQREFMTTPVAEMTPAKFAEIRDHLQRPYDPSHSKPNFIPSFGNFPEFGNVCVTQGSRVFEEWVIENWTNEIHNFHIHQTRFAVSNRGNGKAYFDFPCNSSAYTLIPTDPAGGNQASPTAVFCRTKDGPETGYGDELIQQFYNGHTSTGRDTNVQSESAHDTVPVPRGGCVPTSENGNCFNDNSGCDGVPGNPQCRPGRVTLRIPFNRREQIGQFVYHCHILEHEDRGMMAIIDVRAPGSPSVHEHASSHKEVGSRLKH
jgi:FtsP/CotA-like multicopper oxidase with cupredoxin domain